MNANRVVTEQQVGTFWITNCLYCNCEKSFYSTW